MSPEKRATYMSTIISSEHVFGRLLVAGESITSEAIGCRVS